MEYLVLRDYRTDRLNGGGPAVWTEGSVVEVGDDDAAWVNRDCPGTLDPADSEPEPEPDPEAPATAPPAEQVGGKPPRGRGRRTDSAD